MTKFMVWLDFKLQEFVSAGECKKDITNGEYWIDLLASSLISGFVVYLIS